MEKGEDKEPALVPSSPSLDGVQSQLRGFVLTTERSKPLLWCVLYPEAKNTKEKVYLKFCEENELCLLQSVVLYNQSIRRTILVLGLYVTRVLGGLFCIGSLYILFSGLFLPSLTGLVERTR